MNFDKARLGYVIAGALFGLFLLVSANPVFVVEAGERAVLFNAVSGLKKQVYGEGLHIKIPFLERETVYNIRRMKKDVPTRVASKDLQDIKSEVRIIFSPVVRELTELHSELGPDYAEVILPSITKELLKDVIAENTAVEIIQNRREVSNNVREAIMERARKFNIEVYDVTLQDLEFSQEFMRSVEKKQVAEQELQASKKKAEAAVELARGEAEAARIINQASSRGSDAFIKLRQIEASRKIADTLADSKNVVYLPNDVLLMAGDKSLREK